MRSHLIVYPHLSIKQADLLSKQGFHLVKLLEDSKFLPIQPQKSRKSKLNTKNLEAKRLNREHFRFFI